MTYALVFLIGAILGFVTGAVVMFRFVDRELRRRGIDIGVDPDDFPRPQAMCGYESEL